MITQNRLKELASYDPDTGIFTSISTHGKILGYLTTCGYISIGIDRKQYRAHRLAWLFIHGCIPQYLDHKNNIRSDNRIENLRPASKTQNSCNQVTRRDNKSGIKGVTWCADRQKWKVRIALNGTRYPLGSFSDIDQAAHAAKKFRETLHGEFANHG